MGKRVAIIGMSPEVGEEPPIGDPEWECWGMPWDPSFPNYHCGFEMHDRSLWGEFNYPPRYESYLRKADCPVFMTEAYPDIPQSFRYPMEDVVAEVGDYFCSTFAYMLGLAILQRVDEIGLWKITLFKEEYAQQRPNAEYLIGFARARGIKVTAHEPTSLLKFSYAENEPAYPLRYGSMRAA